MQGTPVRWAWIRLPLTPSQLTGLMNTPAGSLQDEIRNVVPLLQTVELRIERHEPISVRFDDFPQPGVQIDEERIVHRLERHPKQPAGSRLTLRPVGRILRTASRKPHGHQAECCLGPGMIHELAPHIKHTTLHRAALTRVRQKAGYWKTGDRRTTEGKRGRQEVRRTERERVGKRICRNRGVDCRLGLLTEAYKMASITGDTIRAVTDSVLGGFAMRRRDFLKSGVQAAAAGAAVSMCGPCRPGWRRIGQSRLRRFLESRIARCLTTRSSGTRFTPIRPRITGGGYRTSRFANKPFALASAGT